MVTDIQEKCAVLLLLNQLKTFDICECHRVATQIKLISTPSDCCVSDLGSLHTVTSNCQLRLLQSKFQITVELGHGCTEILNPGMQIDTRISKTKMNFVIDKKHKAVMAAQFERGTGIKHCV